MPEELGGDDTIVVAVYAHRHDAEIAKSFLEGHGISAFVGADDVHVPLQLTEGARVYVMSDRGEAALEALRNADLLPSESQEDKSEDGSFDADLERAPGPSRTLIVSFVILILALVAAMIVVNVL